MWLTLRLYCRVGNPFPTQRTAPAPAIIFRSKVWEYSTKRDKLPGLPDFFSTQRPCRAPKASSRLFTMPSNPRVRHARFEKKSGAGCLKRRRQSTGPSPRGSSTLRFPVDGSVRSSLYGGFPGVAVPPCRSGDVSYASRISANSAKNGHLPVVKRYALEVAVRGIA
jgi:hypothetical protein